MNKYIKAITANQLFFVINTIAFLILTPLAINIMGDEFYGIWSILYSVMLFAGIGALGIGSIVNKFAAETTDEALEKQRSDILINAAIIILPMGIFTAGVVWSAGGLIAKNLDISVSQQADFIQAIRICAIGIIPQFLAKIPHGFLLSQYKNNIVRSMDFITNIFPWIGAILVSIFSQNLLLIALWFVFVQTAILVVYIFIMRKYVSQDLHSNPLLIRKMIGFSGYMFIESVAVSMFQHLDKLIVGFVLGPAAAGVYSVGTSVSLRMSLIAGQVTEVMIPYASNKNSLGDHEKLFSVFQKLSTYVSLLTAGVGSLLIIWMREILTVWISAEYAAKYYFMFCILILAYGILSLSRPAHQTLQGIGQVRFSSSLYLLASILMLGCVYFFSVKGGLTGAALANLVMALLLGMIFRVYTSIRAKFVWKDLLLSLLPGTILPAAALAIIQLSPEMITKVCLTVLILAGALIVFLKDPFLKSQLGNALSRREQTGDE